MMPRLTTSLAIVFALVTLTHLTARAEPPQQTRAHEGAVLIIGPTMRLSMRMASGDYETRADWSASATDNLSRGLANRFYASGRAFRFADPNTLMEGRTGQLLRLHALVADAAIRAPYTTRRRGVPEWSLGAGAQEFARVHRADYALIIGGDGAYDSMPRNVLSLASSGFALASAATGSAEAATALGLRALRRDNDAPRVLASLVDVRTGDIIWIRQMDAGDDDPRTAQGARHLLNSLLQHAPI